MMLWCKHAVEFSKYTELRSQINHVYNPWQLFLKYHS